MNKLTKLSRAIVAIAMMLAVSLPSLAHDFEVDGIYYEITDETSKTVEVTYRGSSYYSYQEYGGSVVIPDSVSYNGTTYSVTSIKGYAFNGCSGLTSVTIGNSVTSIGGYAFYDCSRLTSVTIPNSVTSIGDSAFYGCSRLTSVTIPNSVTSIGGYAFHDCSRLTSVTIPNSVTSIGIGAFYGCTGLTSVTIPNSVTSIGDNAFYGCTGLTSVTIPNSVTTIDAFAFSRCSGLTSVSIPNSVTTIDSSAFSSCSSLTEVTFNAENCTAMGSSNAPVFDGCFKLTKLTIGDKVKTIPVYTFKGCTSLAEVTFNAENCTKIGDSSYPVFSACTKLTKLTIGDNVKTIPAYAFKDCTSLTSVSIPNSVTTIGNSAFYGCTGLTSVTIPNSVTTIDVFAFSRCSGLTSVTIPNLVTYIGSYAFSSCSSLTEVTFNAKNCTAMESSNAPVFDGCTKLTKLTIGDNVKTIPAYAFKDCTGLTSVSIPNSVTTIGNSAFYGCTGLTSVTIPNSVTSIGKSAFWECDKLINCDVETTQSTASLTLNTPTEYGTAIEFDSKVYRPNDGVVTLTDLTQDTSYSANLCLDINGITCPIKSLNFNTAQFKLWIDATVGVTSIVASGNYTDCEIEVVESGINFGSAVEKYNNLTELTTCNLNPNTTYKVYYKVNTEKSGVFTTNSSFTTKSLTWNSGEFTATSTTSARLSVETNCDATEGTGYEWKRYDAPDDLTPNKAPCPVVDGKLVGTLRGLNSSAYYKCCPYYTSSSGKTYYGDWFTIFTGDANVYFEPEVRTFDDNIIINNSVIVNGYALAGSDDIIEQGFEYWKTQSAPLTFGLTNLGVMTIKASGISMSVTIANLEYNSTYRYRAYVKTSSGTFYGSEKEFKIGVDPSGIEYVEIDDVEVVEVARYDINGRLLSKPAHGINIIKMSDGTTRKEWVK